MSARTISRPATFSAVPEAFGDRLASGIRWTLWLSVLTAPLGYITTVLLARTRLEAIAHYGLLLLFLGLVSSVLHFGGDAAVIRFLPALPAAQRLSFLLTYFAVICLGLIPWIALAALRPDWLGFVFGYTVPASFQVLLLCLSPVPIVLSIATASLKSAMDLAWAQTPLRLVTAGSFATYALLYAVARSTLAAHSAAIVWMVYFTLAAVAIVAGLWRLRRLKYCRWGTLQWLLPAGFWSYAFSLQQASALGFFLLQLDSLLVLKFAPLAEFGQYVAIMAVAGMLRVFSGCLLDPLLPALANLLASGNQAAAGEVFRFQFRILLLFNAAAGSALILLAGPITAMLGPRFAGLTPVLMCAVALVALSAPGAAGGTLLTGIGQQMKSVWIGLLQIALCLALFFPLWQRWRLLGAVLAFGVSLAVCNVASIAVARAAGPLKFRVAADYVVFGLLLAGVLSAAALLSLPLAAAPLVWAPAMAFFLWSARYGIEELSRITHCLSPFGGALRPFAFSSTGDAASAAAALAVSVIIPTRNRPDELKAVVEDLLRQTELPRQLVIADQSATADSRVAVETALAAAPAEVRVAMTLEYIADPRISGGAVARNRAMRLATGDVWLFLDDDVRLERTFVEELLAVYRQNPQVSGVSGIITNYPRPPLAFRCWSRLFARGPFRDERQWIYWNADRLRNSEPLPVRKMGGGLMSLRADSVRNLRFDTNLVGVSDGEDVDLCSRLAPGSLLVIAPRARLVHHHSPVGRSTEHGLRREAQAAYYLYRRNWNHGLKNRICFAWLNAGFAVAATIASLRRRSFDPWRALLRGARAGSTVSCRTLPALEEVTPARRSGTA